MSPIVSNDGDGAKLMMLAPLAILSTIFLGTATLLVANASLAFATSLNLLLMGTVIFAFAVALLASRGLAQVRALELIGRNDSLTGLPNRRVLHNDIQRECREGREVALAMLDLDGFKHLNDHYGHFIGDAAIRECGKLLLEIAARDARVYRLGGDEYALMMSGAVAGTLLEGLCRRVIERLGKPVRVDDHCFAIGASIGLARSAENEALGSSELMRRADVSMYASKHGGKMRCTWFNPAFDRSREELMELDDELRTALANGEFALAYQPLVDANTQHIVAVESLLRWNRPDGKYIGPDHFVPVAEESGLINAIGLWVLRQACRDALPWDKIKLSVNISAAQLRNPEFPIQLGHILEETGFEAERLELEITETSLVLDPEVAERALGVIRSFGVSVALDDFGTGYASIGFLRQFRFEKLKIDRSLVAQAGSDDGSRAMMLSSITVARAMKMDVTAEGVETQEQDDMVRAAGCDQIQGWLYFKAMPASEIPQHLGKPIDAVPIAETCKSRVA